VLRSSHVEQRPEAALVSKLMLHLFIPTQVCDGACDHAQRLRVFGRFCTYKKSGSSWLIRVVLPSAQDSYRTCKLADLTKSNDRSSQ
jgi:hypothetical protein